MSFRKVLGWTVLFLAAGGAIAGRYAWVALHRTDELLRERLVATLKQVVPEWNVELGTVRFDFYGRIRVGDVRLRTAADQTPLASVNEVVITADREALMQERLVIQQVRLVHPRLHLIRDAEGRWNYEDLVLPRMLAEIAPEVKIEEGTLAVELRPAAGEAATGTIEHIAATWTPSGKRRYVIQAAGQLAPLGTALTANGHWNLNARTWNVQCQATRLKIGADLWKLACAAHPACRQQMERRLQPLRKAPSVEANPSPASPRVELLANLQLQLNRWRGDDPLECKLEAQVISGTAAHPSLPFPLLELQGELTCDAAGVTVKGLRGRHGATQLQLAGHAPWDPNETAGGFTIQAEDLPLDEKLRSRLPARLQQLFDETQPAGRVDVASRWTRGKAGWAHDTTATFKGCTAAHVKFPYRTSDIGGTIRSVNGDCHINLTGRAGRQPVSLRGRHLRTGEEEYRMAVSGLPLDETFQQAAAPQVQATLKALRLQGVADVRYQFWRRGPAEAYQVRLLANVRDGTLNYVHFPYALDRFKGTVAWDGQVWTFSELSAEHGVAKLSGGGTYTLNEQSGVLNLTLASSETPIDQSLKLALPGRWATVWDEFSPEGRLSSKSQIVWTPGAAPAITTHLEVIDGTVSMRSFPYPVEQVAARLTLADNKVQIHAFTGRHEDSKVRLTGWAEYQSEGEWRVRLEELFADDVDPGRRFRRALPKGFREVIESLDPRNGVVSFNGMLEFRGTGRTRDPVTAAWDLETVYSGNSLTIGVDLNNVYGRMFSRGTWDGERVVATGQMDLDSMTVLGYQFTEAKGPLAINGNQLVLGSKEAVSVAGAAGGGVRVASEERITARAIDGMFTLDGIAILDQIASYRVMITMNDARLERYAELYAPAQRQLHGVMNGWCELNGRGMAAERLTGRGQVRVAPAALYELPVIVSIFRIMNFLPPDKTAFHRADVQFDVAGGRFELRRVDLVGQAINLRGRGFVGFDGKLRLDFYSKMPRNQVPIPLVGPLLGEVTTGWMGVEVRGTTQKPVAVVVPVPAFDDAMRRFLGAFEPRPPPRPANAPRGPARR